MSELGGIEESNVQNIFVTLGRLEGKVDGLSGISDRLGKVEILAATTASEVHTIQAQTSGQQTRRPQWPAIVGAVVAMITGTSVIIGLFFTLNQIASAINGVTP